MALGLNTESGGGDYQPIVKYDARAGRVFRVDRAQDASGAWQTDNVNITSGFQAVMDLQQIKVGWVAFRAGMAPDFRVVALGEPLPPRPDGVGDKGKPLYGQCFKMLVKLGKSAGGDVRELASQAKVVIAAIDALHTAYSAAPEAAQGKLPVVSMTGTTAVKTSGQGQTSTNYQPVFSITKWVDRPKELPLGDAPAAPPAAANQGAATTVTQMRATSQVAPAPDTEEF